MSLLGVAMIAVSALLFNDLTSFPGYAVILPVVGAALAVAGGTSAPGGGAEALLSLRPFQWLGKLSYSLYLWHWPVLIIAKEHAGGDVSLGATILLILLAVTFTVVTFLLVENPVRNSTWLKRRSPWITVAVGACLIIVSLGIATGGIAWFGPHPPPQQLAPVVVFPGN
jgi:peptidoglycan/LPS O-acetylase OafA/YrhL